MSPDVVFSLIDRIYEAAVVPHRWQDFLGELSEAFGGAAGLLALQLPNSPRPVHYYLVHQYFLTESIIGPEQLCR